MQTLVRSMPDLHKTLILTHIREVGDEFQVDEMAIATEHAPFRHKKQQVKNVVVGSQVKKKARVDDGSEKEENGGGGPEEKEGGDEKDEGE